jgi:DNA-directed RNA polymerase subunit M/transcription elongation factor TFIIS
MQLCLERIMNPLPMRPRKRDYVCETLLCKCVRDAEFRELDDAKQWDIVNMIERGIFNLTIDIAEADGVLCSFDEYKFLHRYSIQTFRVIGCMDVWLPRVIAGMIDADKLCFLTNEEMNPDANRVERDEIQKRRDQKIEIKASVQYRCRKCKHSEMIPMQYQSRALDEAGSLSCLCVKCGNIQRQG